MFQRFFSDFTSAVRRCRNLGAISKEQASQRLCEAARRHLARSSDIMCSLGDPSKVAKILHWRPTIKLPEIVARRVRAEWPHLARRGRVGNGVPGQTAKKPRD